MSTCGGSFTTQRVVVGAAAIQVLSALDSRTKVTVRADGNNAGNIFVCASAGTDAREGFPLAPNDVFTFEDRGSRAALYLRSSGVENLLAYIMTEGA